MLHVLHSRGHSQARLGLSFKKPSLNHLLHLNYPYRLTYWIEYSEKMRSFKATQKSLLGCYEHTSYLFYLQSSCKTHLKPELLKECFLSAHNKSDFNKRYLCKNATKNI